MKTNVGPSDRFIRFLVGISFLLNIVILEPAVIGTIILLVLGLVFLYTSYSSYCLLYDILNISTSSEIIQEGTEKTNS